MAHKHPTTQIDDDVYCDYSGDLVWACEEAEREAEAERDSKPGEMTVSCNQCGYSGSIERVKVHSCYVQEQGGRCEDFPCCGHTDGDGCQTLPEHTSEYWIEFYANNPDYED